MEHVPSVSQGLPTMVLGELLRVDRFLTREMGTSLLLCPSLEIVVEPWIESLWLALEGSFSPGACNRVTLATTEQNSEANEADSAQCTVDDTDLPAMEDMKISCHPSLPPVAPDLSDAIKQNNTRQSKFTVSG